MSRAGSGDARRVARLRLELAAARLDDELATLVRGPTVGLAALAGLVAGLLPGESLAALGRGLVSGLGSRAAGGRGHAA